MNDPGEIDFAWELYKEAMSKYPRPDLFAPLIRWIEGIRKVQDFFILSFSKESDSLAQWNRYAQGHGFAIEIELEQLIEQINNSNLKGTFKGFFDVSYEADFNKKYVETAVAEYHKAQIANKNHPLGSERTSDLTFNVLSSILAFKHKAYADEQEVRGIFIIPNTASLVTDPIWFDNVSFRVQESRIVPYITLNLHSLNCIKGVKLGPQNKESRDREGLELLLRSKKLTVPVTQSSVPFR